MYCPECDTDPCRYVPDEAHTVESYDQWMQHVRTERLLSRKEVEAIFIHALLLGLDSTEFDDEREEQA